MRPKLFLPLAVIAFAGCSSKKSTPEDVKPVDDSPTTANKLAIESNPMAASYPNHMAVGSPTQPTKYQTTGNGQGLVSSQGLVITALTLAGDTTTTDSTDTQSRVQKYLAVLAATDITKCGDALPKELDFGDGVAACYGADIAYTDHPDAAGQTGKDGSLGKGSSGMTFPYADPAGTSGQACAPAKVNALMEESGRYADTALALHAMMLCAANIQKKTLPTTGDSLDLLGSFATVPLASKKIALSKATVKRIDATDKTYVTEIEGTATNSKGDKMPIAIVVKHVSLNEKNTVFKGVMSFTIRDFNDVTTKVTRAVSLRYSMNNGAVKYRFVRGEFNNDSTSVLNATSGELNSSPASAGGGELSCLSDGWCKGFTEFVLDLDEKGFGKFTYSLILNRNTGSANVFNLETKADKTGVAYFGTGIATGAIGTEDLYRIKGLKCLRSGSGALASFSTEYSNYVQRQDISLNTTTSAWDLVKSYTTFAPTRSCNWDTTNDASHAATFTIKYTQASNGSLKDFAVPLTFPLSNALYSAAEYAKEWTPPTAPTL